MSPADDLPSADGPSGDDLPSATQVWLIRHGETEWSRSGQHTGRTDLPLTPHGAREAVALKPLVQNLDPVLVLSSPRRRALHTAELAGLHVDEVDPDLAEWDYGEYEGMTTAQIRQQVPGWTVWAFPCPGGETAEDVSRRADRVVDRVRRTVADGAVVLLSHGHISRVIGARWIGLPATGGSHLALGTAAPSVLGAEHGTPVLRQWNLPNPAVTDTVGVDVPRSAS